MAQKAKKFSIQRMRDDSSGGTGDDAGLLVGSKTLESLKNSLESGKDKPQLDAMKKVIGHIAKGNCHVFVKTPK